MTAHGVLDVLATCLGVARLDLDAQDACAVRLDDGLVLDIQVLEACDELRLALPLGCPEPARRDAVLAEALLANTLLAATSPQHLAWEPDRQRLVLCQTLRFDEVAPPEFPIALQTFTQTCRTWRAQLQQAGAFSPD